MREEARDPLALDVSRELVARRRCTDCLFIFVFVAAYALLAVLGVQVVRHGNTNIFANFAHGKNFHGERCGVDPAVKDYPLTYFTVPLLTDLKVNETTLVKNIKAVCTNACPVAKAATIPYARAPSTCQPEAGGWCTWYGASTTQIANYCIDFGLLTDGKITSLESTVADLSSSLGLIIVLFILAVIVGFVWLVVIRCCSALFMWGAVIALLAALALLGYFMYAKADLVAEKSAFDEGQVKVCSYVVLGVDAVFVLIVLCSIRALRIASSILKTAALFMMDVKSALIQPIFGALAQLVVIVAFIAFFSLVCTLELKEASPSDPASGTCVFEDGLLNPFCVDVNNSTTTHLLMLYVVLMYFWTAAFVHAFNMYMMAYAAAVWYFSPVGSSGHKMLPHGNTFCDCRPLLIARAP